MRDKLPGAGGARAEDPHEIRQACGALGLPRAVAAPSRIGGTDC